MHKKLINKKEYVRAILTDTLPYETPFFFTNEKLFNALNSEEPFSGLPEIAKLLLNHNKSSRPFAYSVQKGGRSKRKLAIPHPASQIKISEFYRDFDGFIENLCTRSSYSLRFPSRIGSHYFETQFSNGETIETGVEADIDPASFYEQRRWASTYFFYRHFTHMHKFYASKEFSRLEQKYGMLMQVDISKCFESIYTHSISWAVRGKEFSKNTIDFQSFESRFDKIMQNANWSQTNGIIVGPEASRIFSEIIMQAIDRRIEQEVIKNNLDVTIRRYIDDFLMFGNTEKDLLECKQIIQTEIQEFNLHLNESKTSLSKRPLVSPLTIARDEVHEELGKFFSLARESLKTPIGGNPVHHFPSTAADRTIANIRKICRKHNIEYATLASPALAVIARNLNRLRIRFAHAATESPKPKYARTIINEALRIAHFITSMDIRVATSHKLAKIYYEISFLAKKLGVENNALHGQIIDGMRTILNTAVELKISGPEVVNLLIAVEAVCNRSHPISIDDLAKSLGIGPDWVISTKKMNYFDLVTVLYFGRRKQEFKIACSAVISEIESRISSSGGELPFRTTETLLFFDFLSCPHIDQERKKLMVKTVNKAVGSNINDITAIEHAKRLGASLGFISWNGAQHFRSLLERKELHPAYD